MEHSRKFIYILLLFLLFVFGCDFIDSNNWELISVVPAGTNTNALLFQNTSKGFLFGSYVPKIERTSKSIKPFYPLRKDIAIIYTTDSGGENWTKIYEDPGEIEDACLIEDSIFFIKNVYYKDGSVKHSYLMKSSDGGRTWQRLYDFLIRIF